jgi:hypothetical protein
LVSVTDMSLYVSPMPHLLIISLFIFSLVVTAQNQSFSPTDIGYSLYTADPQFR